MAGLGQSSVASTLEQRVKSEMESEKMRAGTSAPDLPGQLERALPRPDVPVDQLWFQIFVPAFSIDRNDQLKNAKRSAKGTDESIEKKVLY
jgi:hypothetical protein